MTERQLPEAMTDEQLVEACGELMEWKKRELPFVLRLLSGDKWVWDIGEGWWKWIDPKWNPVYDWDDAFWVAEVARLRISEVCDAFLAAGSGDGMDLRRSLCRAALRKASSAPKTDD